MAYDAFISYSQKADGLLAPSLEAALRALGKPWYRRRALRVFRDKSSLSASPSLWSSITEALDTARYFILLASPAAAQSEWVRKEVAYWLTHHSPESLLIVLTEGTILWDEQRKDFDWDRTDAVPSELGGVFKDEPLYVDLCWARQEQKVTLEHPDFLNAVADLAAPIHACSKDELVGEDIRQHKKTKFMAWSAGTLLVLLTVSAVIAAYQATLERDEKERQRLVALSGRLAAESRFALEEKRFDLAALLGVEAKRTLSEESDPQIQSALFRAIYSYPQIRTHLHVESFTTSMAFSRDGKRLASAHFDGSIILWDLESKTHRWRVERPSSQRQGDYFGGATDSLSFSKDGKTLAITSGPGVAVWNVETGKLLKQLDAEKVVGDNRNAVTGKRAGMRQLAISQDHQKVAVVISSYPNLVLHVWSLESSASTKIKLEKPLNSPFMYFSSHGHLVIEPNEVFEPILNREADNQESNSKTVVLNPETGEPVKDAWGDRVWDPIMLANLHKERLRKFLSEKELPLDDPDLPLAIGLGPPRNSMEAIRRIRVDERQDTLDMKQSIVAAVTVEGDILLLDMDPAERTNVVKESQFTFGFGNGVALSRDASTIISGQTIFGTTLTFSDAQTGRVLGEIKQSDTEDSSLTGGVSADGKTVVFVTRDFTTVMVYRAPDVLNRFQLPEGALARSVAVSPTGNMLAVGFQFGRLMLWDIPSQKILSDRQISAEKSPIMALAYSGDGEHLAIGSDVTAADVVRIWDLRDEQIVAHIPLRAVAGVVSQYVGRGLTRRANRVNHLLFDAESRRIAVTFRDGILLLWDVERGHQIGSPINISEGQVVDGKLAFSPEGTRLAFAERPPLESLRNEGRLSKLILIDVENARILGKPLLEQEERIVDVAFSKNGREITVLESRGGLKTLELDTGWEAAACEIANRNLTCGEWERFFGPEAYRKTCPDQPGPIDC